MKKINSFINNNVIKIITIFLLLQPFLDMITGLQEKYSSSFLSLGMIFRFIFMILIGYYIIFISKFKYKRLSVCYIAVIISYIIVFLIVSINIKGMSLIPTEVKWIIKNFYFPILLVGFVNIFSDHKHRMESKTFIKILFTYGLIIVICKIVGVESSAYTQGKTGYIGIFNSANEVSAVISLLLPFLFFYKINKKYIFIKLIILMVTMYCTLIIGSKTAFLCFFIVSSTFFLEYIIQLIKDRKYTHIKLLSFTVVMSVTAIFIALPYTNFYKNIEKHITFLDIDNIGEIFTKDNFNRLIFSDRLTFLGDTKEIYNNASPIQKIVGIGYATLGNQKTIEIDYADIYYRYSPLGFIIYFIPLIVVITGIFKYAINAKYEDKTSYILSILLSLVLALFSGHIFTAPSVSIYVSLILALALTAEGHSLNNDNML